MKLWFQIMGIWSHHIFYTKDRPTLECKKSKGKPFNYASELERHLFENLAIDQENIFL